MTGIKASYNATVNANPQYNGNNVVIKHTLKMKLLS